MKKMKKNLLMIIIAIMLCAVCSLSAFAFSDVKDEELAVSINVLENLGIIEGFGDDTFRPDEALTRAQFTKMAVLLLPDIDEQLSLAAGKTIFPDVKSNHWAIKYINYAAQGSKAIINGYTDGYFYPGEDITFAQAVTILMRLLGHTDASVGMVWPDGYLNAAKANGLTAGLELAAKDSISRADAVILFNNMLLCLPKDGGSIFLSNICPGGVVEKVLLVDNDARMPDNGKNAIKYLEGTAETTLLTAFRPADALVNSIVTVGINKDRMVQVLLPVGKSVYKEFVLTDATAAMLYGADGSEIKIDASQEIIYNGLERNYGSIYLDLQAGAMVKLYYNTTGSIIKIYINTANGSEAEVILADKIDENTLPALFGIAKGDYTVIKDGCEVDSSALAKYDSVVYDAAGKVFYVSSLKLSGIYEDVTGDYSRPDSLKILGEWFGIADCAYETVNQYKPSEKSAVTAIITADNRIAALYPQSIIYGQEIGLASSQGTLTLPNGLVLSGEVDNAGSFEGRLAYVSQGVGGKMHFSNFTYYPAADDLNIAARKLGDMELADNIAIYDTVNGYSARKILLSDIVSDTVAKEKVLHYGLDSSGKIKLLVLNDVTGDCYTYGKISVGYESITIADKVYATYWSYPEGEYCGVAIGPSGYADGQVEMEKLTGLTTHDFLNDRELMYRGKLYHVASNVSVYLEPVGKYVSLYAARSYGGEVEVYCDKTIGKVRCVVVK